MTKIKYIFGVILLLRSLVSLGASEYNPILDPQYDEWNGYELLMALARDRQLATVEQNLQISSMETKRSWIQGLVYIIKGQEDLAEPIWQKSEMQNFIRHQIYSRVSERGFNKKQKDLYEWALKTYLQGHLKALMKTELGSREAIPWISSYPTPLWIENVGSVKKMLLYAASQVEVSSLDYAEFFERVIGSSSEALLNVYAYLALGWIHSFKSYTEKNANGWSKSDFLKVLSYAGEFPSLKQELESYLLKLTEFRFPQDADFIEWRARHAYQNQNSKMAALLFGLKGSDANVLAAAEIYRSLGMYNLARLQIWKISDIKEKLRFKMALATDRNRYSQLLSYSHDFLKQRDLKEQDELKYAVIFASVDRQYPVLDHRQVASLANSVQSEYLKEKLQKLDLPNILPVIR